MFEQSNNILECPLDQLPSQEALTVTIALIGQVLSRFLPCGTISCHPVRRGLLLVTLFSLQLEVYCFYRGAL